MTQHRSSNFKVFFTQSRQELHARMNSVRTGVGFTLRLCVKNIDVLLSAVKPRHFQYKCIFEDIARVFEKTKSAFNHPRPNGMFIRAGLILCCA